MRLAAVVLAAGASTRMGRPKPLIKWRGRPFAWHTVALAKAAGAEPVVVVQGAVSLPSDAANGAAIVRNEAWAQGPLGSLACGLRAVQGARPHAVMVLTIDRPHVEPATVQALAEAVRGEPGAVWQPRYAGRRGHPIVYPAPIVEALLKLRPPDTPRDLLARPEVARLRRVLDVDDAAVLDNLDRPGDLARLP